MRAIKRLVSVLLAIVLIVNVSMIDVNATDIIDSGMCGDDVSWSLDKNGVMIISGNGPMQNYSAWNSPWMGKTSVRSVIIEYGVTNIGEYAFDNCFIEKIEIPSSVSSIGKRAFDACSRLSSIQLPSSIREIGDYAFCGTSLERVDIPEGVLSIGYGAFLSCSELVTFSFSSTVTKIGSSAFYNCNKLKDIYVSDSNSYYCTEDGVLFNKQKTELVLHPSNMGNTEYRVPDGVTALGDSSFRGCSKLNNLYIPTSLKTIGTEVFSTSGRTIPLSIHYGGSDDQWRQVSIGKYNDALNDAMIYYNDSQPDIVSIVLGSSSLTFDKTTGTIVSCDDNDVKIEIPDRIDGSSVKKIGATAFRSCENLQYVFLPNTLTEIGGYAFDECVGLKGIDIPDTVSLIGENAFYGCSDLEYVKLPKSLLAVGDMAFEKCGKLTVLSIPEGTVDLGDQTFMDCKNIRYVLFPSSLCTIGIRTFSGCDNLAGIYLHKTFNCVSGYGAFLGCDKLTDIFYEGNQSQWSYISVFTANDQFKNAKVHYNTTADDFYAYFSIDSSTLMLRDYIYDVVDPGANVALNTDTLKNVDDATSATSAVQTQVQSMTSAQKSSATGADLATLYAETAVAKAASTTVSGTDILINKAAVTELETVAKQTSAAVETALVSGGVATARYLSNTVTLVTEETGEISLRIDPDILTTEVDKIVVEAPTYAITLKVDDLKEDLTEILTITAQDVGSGFGLGDNKKTTVKVNLPNGKTSNPVTLSLPKDSGDTTYQAVVSTSGTATSSKYNPATTTMDGKVSTSGSYTVKTNQKDFSDIANKSAEMQNAIRYLASKGIINGTDATHFSPDGSITRAEIAALMVRALGKLDNSAKPTFKDVTTSNWYYATAASSQKAGLINGYEDNTFRGGNQINKEQIVAVSARVLTNEMGYKAPSNPSSYLGKYSDGVAQWAQSEVALATRENLVVYRADGTFSGSKGMTRGDAAIIIYRLFQRIW